MAAPLAEKGVELERTLGYFQFNRDCDDEEVRMLILCKWADDPGEGGVTRVVGTAGPSRSPY